MPVNRTLSVMNKLIALAIIVYILQINNAYACFVPPSEQHTPWKELVTRTNNIYLAKVISSESSGNWRVKYNFVTIKTLKGKKLDSFVLHGIKKHPEEVISTHNNHTSPFFWAYGGRSWNGTDCIISPTFEDGDMYLIFKDEPYHNLSFEKIESMEDLWLRTVTVFLGPEDENK